jgi:hypothetical protein
MTERPLGSAEHNLVLATWIKEFRASPYAGCLPNHVSTSIIRSCIDDLIKAGATLRGVFEGETCLGWVCEDLVLDPTGLEQPVIHFIYTRSGVKPEVAKAVREALVPVSGGIYTYRTKTITDYLGPTWRHRPGIARSRSLKVAHEDT